MAFSARWVRRGPGTVAAMPTRWMQRLPWPLPALLAWGAGWAVHGAGGGLVAGTLAGALLALAAHGAWRRAIAAGGFPLSALALGAALPPWAWGLAALPLALAYPLGAWRDAPFFPTPARALEGLADVAPLPQGAGVLDAGCGIGHGLAALARVYPRAQLEVQYLFQYFPHLPPPPSGLVRLSDPWLRDWDRGSGRRVDDRAPTDDSRPLSLSLRRAREDSRPLLLGAPPELRDDVLGRLTA